MVLTQKYDFKPHYYDLRQTKPPQYFLCLNCIEPKTNFLVKCQT